MINFVSEYQSGIESPSTCLNRSLLLRCKVLVLLYDKMRYIAPALEFAPCKSLIAIHALPNIKTKYESKF